MRRLLPLALLLTALAMPSTAGAAVSVGVGDQNFQMFQDANFRDLGIKRTRYFIRWNAARNQGELDRADAFVAGARSRGASVLMHISSDTLIRRRARLPSTSQYKREVRKLILRYRSRGVKEWGVWNEANHDSQPTYRSPSRAASFYKIMRQICRGCTLVPLDVLDQAGVERYISRWFRALSPTLRKRVTRIGIHNYSDVNRKRSSGTRDIIRTAKRYNRRAKFWFTETGGVVQFGRSFPCSPTRAKNRTQYMFTLARKFRRDVQRLYVYSWFGEDCDARFDAGLVTENGTPRPALASFRAGIRRSGFKR